MSGKTAVAISLIIGTLALAPLVSGQEPMLIELPTLGGPYGFAEGVSADGTVVVGASRYNDDDPYSHAFIWTADSGMRDLGTLGGPSSRALDVSADGAVVVGFSAYKDDPPLANAFRWTEQSGMVDLGTTGTGTGSSAAGVSADGSVVVGSVCVKDWQDLPGECEQHHAFRWTGDSGMVSLGTLGNGPSSWAAGVSADGSVVVGSSYTDAERTVGHAFYWTEATDMVDLGTLGGNVSGALDVSADGTVVVGSAQDVGGDTFAFRWTAETGMVNLGALDGFSSSALGVSADGSVVVGRVSHGGSDNRAFRWTEASGMIHLDDWLRGLGVVIEGNVTVDARDVSADGSVIVGAMTGSDGYRKAFVAMGLAQEKRWEGSEDPDWHNDDNWDSGSVPQASDIVVIDTAAPHSPILSGAAGEAQAITVGNEAAGSLTISDGALLSTGQGVLGGQTGSFGDVNATGVETRWENRGALYVGSKGLGSLLVAESASVQSRSATIGREEDAGGSVRVGSGGSLVVQEVFTLGDRGTGSLLVEDGGLVSAYGLTLGAESGGEGKATLKGADSSLTTTDLVEIGLEGRGELLVEEGAKLGTGGGGYLGVSTEATGEATVRGAGSSWELVGALQVGREGAGMLTVESGASVESSGGQIGFGPEALGGVTVTGTGSQWVVSGDLTLGLEGVGTLDVDSGGIVSVEEYVTIGNDAGSTGTVAVTGSGTTLSLFKNLGVGVSGEGTLTLADDGAAEVYDGEAIIALNLGSVGLVEIGGGSAPGRLDVPTIRFGQGAGELRFDHTGQFVLEADVSGNGAIVQRAGSTVLEGDLGDFTGTTGVFGGTLAVNGELGGSLVLAGGRIAGTGTLPQLTIPQGAAASPGNSIGTMTTAEITFEPGSTYEAEINALGESDRIHATGTATLNGGKVLVIPFPDVALDTPYTILTADEGVSGTFEEAAFSFVPRLYLTRACLRSKQRVPHDQPDGDLRQRRRDRQPTGCGQGR